MIANANTGAQGRGETKVLKASDFFHLSSINEAPNQVLGDRLIRLETFQEFTDKGTVVQGGNAGVRNWTDKTFIPVTLSTQCIDCLHCVVACPHQSIGYEVTDREVEPIFHLFAKTFNLLPGIHLDPRTETHQVKKGATNYSHCKGCFVCASACPTGAIHFVPLERVDLTKFDGAPVQPEQVPGLYRAPDRAMHARVTRLLEAARARLAQAGTAQAAAGKAQSGAFAPIVNGSRMLAHFVEQARFEYATFYPITPNTLLLKQLEGLSHRLEEH